LLFLRLLYESFYKPHGYYFFSTSPALGGVLLLPLLAGGVYASYRKALTWWPLWLLALGSIGLYSIATPTGVRRAIPLVFVASLLLGEALDWAVQSRRLSRAAVVTVALAVVLLLASQTLATARALSNQRLVLPRDFDWIGADMKSFLEKQVVDPRTRDAVLELKNPIRAMCLFYLLQDHPRRVSDPLFSLQEIREYYLTTDPEKFK